MANFETSSPIPAGKSDDWLGVYRAYNDYLERAYSRLCVGCGACCSFYAAGVEAPEDQRHTRIEINPGEAPPEMTILVKGVFCGPRVPCEHEHVAMRGKTVEGWDTCIAFQGVPGQSGCGCSIYSERPKICRLYEAGSTGCLKSRAWANFAELTNEDIARLTREY